jgi:hypothetical protein
MSRSFNFRGDTPCNIRRDTSSDFRGDSPCQFIRREA